MSAETDEPIKIEWDDLKSRKVDQRLKEQEAVERNRRQAEMNPLTTTAQAPGKTSILHNSIFVMACFGLLGGLLAWGGGEALRAQGGVERTRGHEQTMTAFSRQRAASSLDAAAANLKIDQLKKEKVVDQAEVDRLTERAAAATQAADQATRGIEGLKRDNPDDLTLAISVDPTLSEAQRSAKLDAIEKERKVKHFIDGLIRFGLSGLLIAMCLSVAEPLVDRNFGGAAVNGIVGAACGLVGGVIVALFVDRLYAALVSGTQSGAVPGDEVSSTRVLARAVTWGVLGLFLTLGPGLVMRNIKKLTIGLLGGLIGGLIGGALYDPIFAATHRDEFSRLVVLVVIGLFAGLGTGLIENAAKNGWLKVTAGLITGKQFILYRNPTFIGSGPECPIYLFRDPLVGKRHAAIHIVPGGFELENLPLGSDTQINGKPVSRVRLRSGDQIQVGMTSFMFQEKTRQA